MIHSILQGSSKLQNIFEALGNEFTEPDNLFEYLEEFVSNICGMWEKDLNEVS